MKTRQHGGGRVRESRRVRGGCGRRGVLPAVMLAGAMFLGGGCGGDRGREPETSADEGITDAGFTQALDAAEQRLDTGDRAAAETILATAVRRRPDDPRTRELLGRVAMGRATEAAAGGASAARVRSLHAAAWEEYRRAVAGRPEDAGLHASAGLVALTAGDDDSALELFDRAADLDGTMPQPRLYAGQIRLSRGQHAAAAADFEAVLTLDPSEPFALASLAMVRLAEDRPADAVDLVAEARALAPDDVALRVQEVRVLRLAGQPEAAIGRILANPVADRVAMGMIPELAASLRAMGRIQEAAAAWETVWEAGGPRADRAAAAVGAAEAWADTGDVAAAWAWIARAREAGAAAGGGSAATALAELERRLRPGGAAGG